MQTICIIREINHKPYILNWYLAVLRNYAGFSGRARRKEYWMFTLFSIIFSIVASLLDGALDTKVGPDGSLGLISMVYSLAVFIPSLAVGVRRLHDIGKSGWYLLIVFIPLAGVIWLLVLLCTEGQRGANEYGENPKGIDDFQTDFA
jgi:uncharacterized membrane protein YhaH (DUF805 family)